MLNIPGRKRRQTAENMDLETFNLLKSVAATEKEYNVRSECFDFATLDLKFPKNVITVAPPISNAPPPLPGEIRCTKLSTAVCTARLRAENGGPMKKGCSIVVHEGIYFDSLDAKSHPIFGMPLEIVGLKNVRLIMEKSLNTTVAYAKLFLRNILIFDRRHVRHNSSLHLMRGSTLECFQVTIHSPRAMVFIVEERSKLNFLRSVVCDCWYAIFAEKSDVRLEDCVMNSHIDAANTNLLHFHSSSLEAKNSSFSHWTNTIVFLEKTRATVLNCEFDGHNVLTSAEGPGAIGFKVYNGSGLILRNTSISKCVIAAFSRGCETKLIADNCVIANGGSAFEITLNSHGLVKNCKFICLFAGIITNNVKGKIIYQNNKMINGAAPRFLKDIKSLVPRHDWGADLNTIIDEQGLSPETPTDKEWSQRTEQAGVILDAAGERGDLLSAFEDPDMPELKTCENCMRSETPGDTKMKYCVRCRKVSYCSKECQETDWGDHKLFCRPADGP